MAAKPIRVLHNAQALIAELAAGGAQSPAELAEALEIPRSSVYRLVDGLHAVQLTGTGEDARVSLSLRWLHLADRARAAMTEWRGARELLDDLSARTGQTAYLSVPRGGTAVCIDWSQGRGVGLLALRPGRTLPLHAGAAGRALLAHSDLEGVLERARQSPPRAFTPATLVSPAALRADAARTRREGYALSDEDVTVGVGALGLPLIGPDGAAMGALSMGGLIEDVRAGRAENLALLRAAAATLVEAASTPAAAPATLTK